MRRLLANSTVWLLLSATAVGSAWAADFRIQPERVTLTGNFSQAQLLVTAIADPTAGEERADDLTGRATYVSSAPEIVSVDAAGRLRALANGLAQVTATVDGVSHAVPVQVEGVLAEPKLGFMEYVAPVLTKSGCNAGACHASQYGKGGLKLTVFTFDPHEDYASIVRDRAQRRVDFLNPAQSLFVLKPTLAVPHGGGRRLVAGSDGHQILTAWIAGGAARPTGQESHVTRLTVLPKRRVGTIGLRQQLQVVATYADGRTRDVTDWSRFDSLDPASVGISPTGLAEVRARGQTGVMVRYEGQAEISHFVTPFADTVELTGWQSQNFIDDLAAAKFRELGVPASPLCDDATFLRRAYIDAIGSHPTVEATTAFLDSTDPDKRKKLVDQLLGLTGDPALDVFNDKYAAYWTLRWSDLLKNAAQNLGERNMWAYHNWIRESFRTNKPLDTFFRELLTAKGSPLNNGPASFFLTSNNNPLELGESTAQIVLGLRIGCAKCHHHPFEKYGQVDYYGFAAFFQRVGAKYIQEQGVLSGEQIVFVRSSGEMNAPRIGPVKPTPIDGEPVDHPVDRRIALADWLVAPNNEMFTRSVVNRYMGYLLGSGIIHPVDDMRATNPASNPELLDALAKHFRQEKFDAKRLMRTIMQSRLYQLDSQPLPANATDTRFYSHYAVKRIAAEPLLDAVDYATGAKTRFVNPSLGSTVPPGTKAIELPDSDYSDLFLITFGKPRRVSVCECERTPDENLAQALHTLNGELLASKIATAGGRVAALVEAKKSHEEIVTELYLATLCRRPSPAEMSESRVFLAEIGDPTECYQDLLWALLNSKQFLFVH